MGGPLDLPRHFYLYKLIVQTSLNVRGVQNLVCLVAVGLAKELVVELLNCQVVLGLAQSILGVILVQNSRTNRTQIHIHTNLCGLNGLATAVDTTAGASHDLDELNVQLACLHHVQQLLCHTGAGSNRNVDSQVTQLVGSGLDAFYATNLSEVHLL